MKMTQIPILIQQMIDTLNDPAESFHVKENTVRNLENIKIKIDLALNKHRKVKTPLKNRR
jgi:hypothetical protein